LPSLISLLLVFNDARQREREGEREKENLLELFYFFFFFFFLVSVHLLCAPACVCSKKAKRRTEVTISTSFFSFLKRRVRLFSATTQQASPRRAHRPQRSLPAERKKILTKQKFVAEPDIENKGTQNSLFFVNAQRETSFQRDDSVDWFAFNSRGWISEGRFSSFSQCA
jgi:hypothetical protein